MKQIYINTLFLTLLLFLASCTWDYDWDWLNPGGSGSNFTQLNINDGTTNLTTGIHSLVINNTTYQISFNGNNIFFNNNSSLSKFNSNTFESTGLVPSLSNQVSVYYSGATPNNPQFLFNNSTSSTLYACANIESANLTCTATPTFNGLNAQPTQIAGNAGYQYAVLSTDPIYMANNTESYAQISVPQDIGATSVSYSSITTDINGNLYALVTYNPQDSTQSQSTYLDSYDPSVKRWKKILNNPNIISVNTPLAANSNGTVFFLNPPNANAISCSNGQLRVPIGYTKDNATQVFYALINNGCNSTVNPVSLSVNSSNTVYITLSNNTVFYGTIQT